MQLYERLLGASFARLPHDPVGAMHAIMGITYGVFLTLLFPNATRWLSMPPGFEPAFYGWISWILSAFALGVGLSGIRDLAASFALARSVEERG